MRLENKFQVPASPEKTWDLLIDVPRIVPCMPGAQLTEVVGDDAWKAKIHVKIGPISLQFLSDIVREEMHVDEQRVKLSAHANEARGRGYAEATIESQLSPIDAGTEVTIVTELALQGTVAQYGRGVVADVSTQLTKEFANGLERLLEDDQSPNGGAPAETSGDASGTGGAGSAAAGAAPSGASGSGASGSGASGSGASASGGAQSGASVNRVQPVQPAAAPKPIGGVRLGLKAMWFGIGRRLRRLFGGGSR
jgi:carbon monoxide dehydrogenase subunit G